MILELRIKNFLSFKDEVRFSFRATKDKTFEDCQVVEIAPNIRVLRLAIVYGANASGKSNLIKAFDFLRYFWFNRTENKDKSTKVIPFLLNKETVHNPSEFSLVFYLEGIKYIYSLALKREHVISEKLLVYPKTKPVLVFDRKLNEGVSEITFNTSKARKAKISQAAKDEITVKCLTNMSVLAAYNQVNVVIPDMEKVVKWIKSQYDLLPLKSNTGLLGYTEHAITESKAMKDFILNFLQRAGYNVTEMNTRMIEAKIQAEALPEDNGLTDISDEEKERLKKGRIVQFYRTEFKHTILNEEGNEEVYKLLKKHQSKGKLRTLGLAGLLRGTIDANAFLPIDEVEISLHPQLAGFIIKEFLKQKGQSQLLLTTHCDALLEEDGLFRKDNIWFANKKENGSTELYSMAKFRGANRINSRRKAYKSGKFKAIPNI
jgi:AAA15 family ATPase/GTPase